MSVFPPETFHSIEKQGSLTYCKQIQENLEHSFHDMNFRDLDIFSETPSGNCSKFPAPAQSLVYLTPFTSKPFVPIFRYSDFFSHTTTIMSFTKRIS